MTQSRVLSLLVSLGEEKREDLVKRIETSEEKYDPSNDPFFKYSKTFDLGEYASEEIDDVVDAVTIPMEKGLAKDLVEFKLQRLRTLVQEIVDRWNEESTTVFIEKVKNGLYENGEKDAIELRQLLLEEKKLEEVEKKIK